MDYWEKAQLLNKQRYWERLSLLPPGFNFSRNYDGQYKFSILNQWQRNNDLFENPEDCLNALEKEFERLKDKEL